MPPKKDKAAAKDTAATPQCKATKLDGTKCTFPVKFYGLCGFHQVKSVRPQNPNLFATHPNDMFSETSERSSADSPTSEVEEEETTEEEEATAEDPTEEDRFAAFPKPEFGITEPFLKYLDSVVDIVKGDFMGEWDVWCVIKGYTGHAWDTHGGDWVEKTHKRLEHLEKGDGENIAERMAALETRMSIQAQELQELYTLKGKYEELHRNYENLRRANEEKTERINFLELQLMSATSTDGDLAKDMADVGLGSSP